MARAIPTSRQEVVTIKKLGIHMPNKQPTLMRSNPLHHRMATEGGSNKGGTVKHRLYMEGATVSWKKGLLG